MLDVFGDPAPRNPSMIPSCFTPIPHKQDLDDTQQNCLDIRSSKNGWNRSKDYHPQSSSIKQHDRKQKHPFKPTVTFCEETIRKSPEVYKKKRNRSDFDVKHSALKKEEQKNVFVAEDFQLTPLLKYQQRYPNQSNNTTTENRQKTNQSDHSIKLDSNFIHRQGQNHQSPVDNKNKMYLQEIVMAKIDSVEEVQSQEGFLSPVDIRNHVFKSSDFIDTPLKKRKFSLTDFQNYPKTSTPLPNTLSTPTLTPNVDRILNKKLKTPEIKPEPKSCLKLKTTDTKPDQRNCLQLKTPETRVIQKGSLKLKTPEIKTVQNQSLYGSVFGDVKEMYHLDEFSPDILYKVG